MFKTLLDWVRKDCGMLLEVTRTELAGFDFLGNAVWPEIMTVMERRLSPLFSVGIADQFMKVWDRLWRGPL